MNRRAACFLAFVVLALWACRSVAGEPIDSRDSGEGETGGAPAAASPQGDAEAARALEQQAAAAYQEGRYVEAAQIFQRAWETYQHPHFQYNIGQCYRAAGQWEEAAAAYQQRLQHQPVPDNLIHVHIGRCLLELGRRDEAEAALLRYMRLEPGSHEATVARRAIVSGRWWEPQERRSAETLEQANELHERAAGLADQGQFVDAAHLYVQGYEQLSDIHEFLFNAALCFLEGRSLAEAVQAFRRYLETPGADPEAWAHLGASLRFQDELAAAAEAYERYLDEEPEGEFAEEAQEVVRSLRRFDSPPREETAQGERAGEDEIIRPVVSRVRRGVDTWRSTGDLSGVPAPTEARVSPAGRYNMGFCHMRAREWEQAIAAFEECVQAAGDEGGYTSAHLDIAHCLIELSRTAEALEHIRAFRQRADEAVLPGEEADRRWATQLEQRCQESGDDTGLTGGPGRGSRIVAASNWPRGITQ